MKLYHSPLMKFHGKRALDNFDFELYDPAKDKDEPTQFWLYSFEDHQLMRNHRGYKCVFWHGIDVLFLLQNKERLLDKFLEASPVCACHNHVQQNYLAEMGIYAFVRPWFINDIKKYKKQKNLAKKVYMSSHVGREQEYGEPMINAVACAMPDWEFHIFGTEPTFPFNENVFYHGQVPEDEMDALTNDHAATIRWKPYDGFAQTTMKAILRGQLAITKIPYNCCYHADGVEDIIRILNDYELHLRTILPDPGLNNFDWMGGL
jgi:hypothetical protein